MFQTNESSMFLVNDDSFEKHTKSKKTLLNFLYSTKILKHQWCCQCECMIVKCKNPNSKYYKDGYNFACYQCYRYYSIRANSVLYNQTIPLKKFVSLLYKFFKNRNITSAASEAGYRNFAICFAVIRNCINTKKTINRCITFPSP